MNYLKLKEAFAAFAAKAQKMKDKLSQWITTTRRAKSGAFYAGIAIIVLLVVIGTLIS